VTPLSLPLIRVKHYNKVNLKQAIATGFFWLTVCNFFYWQNLNIPEILFFFCNVTVDFCLNKLDDDDDLNKNTICIKTNIINEKVFCVSKFSVFDYSAEETEIKYEVRMNRVLR